MKLRISGNSLRFRLLRSEVEKLGRGESLVAAVQFGDEAGAVLRYALEAEASATDTSVRYVPGDVQVQLPLQRVQTWASGDEVGVYEDLPAGAGRTLQVLVEKDYACLDRSDADNEDTFEHPMSGAVC